MPTPVVVCGVDESRASQKAAIVAAQLSAELGARLLLVTVIEPDAPASVSWELEHDLRADGRALLARIRDGRPQLADAEDAVEIGAPADALVRCAARRHARLIVTGAGNRGLLKTALFGSMLDEVMECAPCPVVVVPDRP